MSTTGNGSTVSLGTQGGSYRILSIGGHEESIASLNDSDLSTQDFMESCPSDLAELGEVDVQVRFRANEGLPNLKVVETITFTYPLAPGASTNGSLAGTGFITKRKFPDLQNGQLLTGTFTIKFDGKTGPALTPET